MENVLNCKSGILLVKSGFGQLQLVSIRLLNMSLIFVKRTGKKKELLNWESVSCDIGITQKSWRSSLPLLPPEICFLCRILSFAIFQCFESFPKFFFPSFAAYYRGAMGILLVYDVTDESSFNSNLFISYFLLNAYSCHYLILLDLWKWIVFSGLKEDIMF